MKAEELISMLLEDDKLKNSRLFGDKVYKDEPILQPASKLIKEQTPDKIMQMKQLAFTSEAVWRTEEWLFCEQGLFMAGYDDCFDSFDIHDVRPLPRPTYKLLNTDELRGYFTWRAGLRRGEAVPFCETYVSLYASELVNLIGVDSPEAAFDRLYELRERFAADKISRQVDTLLCDMAAYFSLPDQYRARLPVNETDSALIQLINCDTADNDTLFAALTMLSSYKIDSSSAFKKRPMDIKNAVCDVIKAFSEHYGAKGLAVKLFGLMLSHWYTPFRSAVFFNNGKAKSYEYKINDIRIYICEHGFWQLKSYVSAKSKKLGAILRTADSLIRERLSIGTSLKKGDTDSEEDHIITKAIDAYFERKRREAMPKIEIDMSKLGDIRRAADITRDKLIVEEEQPEETSRSGFITDVIATAEPVVDSCDELPLTGTETAFVHALLYGGDFKAAATGSMPSLLADSINDKLFDTFGDTVIDFDGDTPFIIEDYEEELKGKIPE